MAWLERYQGEFGRREASHLLRRITFGVSQDQIEKSISDGLTATLANALTEQPMPDPPVDQSTGVTWVTGENYDQQKGANYYYQGTRAWWVGLMVEDPVSIREKLTLFWMNHFATEASVVHNAVYTYGMMNYLREHCLRSFRDMVRQVTTEQAMLVYLNGNTNTKGNPNENYARELQELFTIGKGPEVAEGDYTNYTEQDVKAAARVLTGWRIARGTGETTFQPQQHDITDKTFSQRYQHTTIRGRSDANAGATELDELITMILAQPATSEYIVGKIYRWFVNSTITDDVSANIIRPLAQQLSQTWQVKPILEQLFASDHFFDASMIGAQLRSPADLVIGTMRTVATKNIPPTTDYVNRYRFLLSLSNAMTAQQMDILEPPSVAGLPAYYQTPTFYEEWLTTATLPLRNAFTDSLTAPIRLGQSKVYLLDSIAFVQTLTSPSESLALVTELNQLFFALPFSEATTLKIAEDVLMDGGRYYEWSAVWQNYLNDPNTANTQKVRSSLDRLFTYLFRMAEFQLF